MAKKPKTPKPGYAICTDCGAEYKIGAPHQMFCEAHTCEECGSSFNTVLDKDDNARRLCDRCSPRSVCE